MRHLARRSVVALGVSAFVGMGMLPATAASASNRVVVPLGHSIQKAINEAPPGTVIVLEPGVYKQSVMIRKDEITLQGAGAFEDGTIMVPPDKLPANLCRQIAKWSGVCVLATHIRDGVITKTADNDRVSGIMFDGGWNNGVFGYGTTGLRITNNGAENYREYGFARFNSSGGVMENNEARGLDGSEAGMYVGDSPNAHAVVRGNDVSGSLLGVFVRHSHGVEVAFNNLEGNCEGILYLDDGQPGGAGDGSIHDNVAHSNNLFCPGGEENPPAQGGGILLLGATNTSVWQNDVLANAGEQFNSGGIVLLSAAPFGGGSDVINDTVKDNTAFGNHPADIIWDGSGTGNVFTGNHCEVSVPVGLC